MPIFPKAKFDIVADDKSKRGVDSAQSNLERLRKQISLTGVASIAAAGIGGLGLLTAAGIRLGDELAKTSQKLGLSTEALAGLRNAARLTGVESNKLDLGIQRMTRRIAEAAKGSGEAQSAIKELGLDAKRLADQSPDEQFRSIAEAMSQVGSQSDRVRLGFKLFDSEGVDLIRTLDIGVDGLDAAATEAERFGTAISSVRAREIELAGDAIGRVKTAAEGLSTQLAASLGPSIASTANAFADLIAFITSEGIPAFRLLGEQILGFDTNVRALSMRELEVRTVVLTDKIAELNKEYKKTVELSPLFAGFRGRALERLEDALRESKKKLDEVLARKAELESGGPQRSDELFEILPGSLPQKLDESGPRSQLKRFKEAAERRQALEEAQAKREEETAQKAAQREEERRQLELEGVRNFFKTREQLELDAFDRREEIINANMEAGADRDALLLENEEAKAQYLIALEQRKQNAINEAVIQGIQTREQFEQASGKAQIKGVLGTLQSITAGVATHDKRLFQLNKAAAIGNAIVNTAEGVTKALSAYPPPLSFAMAAAQAAAGVAQISAIRSASFGGGSTPSVVGSTPTLEGQPVSTTSAGQSSASASTRMITEVHIHGSVVARDDLKHIFEDLFESDEVIIQGNTRQAATIRAGR